MQDNRNPRYRVELREKVQDCLMLLYQLYLKVDEKVAMSGLEDARKALQE